MDGRPKFMEKLQKYYKIMAKWKEKYREDVANMSNDELYVEFMDVAAEHFNDEFCTSADEFRFLECKKEFEYRLKTNGFLE